MFQQLLIAAAIKAMCAALCQLFGWCICQDECPDGVCDSALEAVDDLGDSSPAPVASPSRVQASFQLQWEHLNGLVDATVAFVAALKLFLGLDRKVG